MEYLLKVSAVITIFYLIYKVFLQRDTFFESNRGFLLLGLISSFIIPFLVIPIYIEQPPTLITNYSFSDATVLEKIEAPFNVLDYLPVVYLAGVLFFFIRFIIQFVSLSTLIIKNKSEKRGVFKFIKIKANISPFSFFNWIVYHPNQFTKSELEQIITHEKVHVLQYHSIDVLLTQLSGIVLWFNPFVWFYNNDIKQNLEFIADQKAQLKFNCKKSYQTTLLKTSVPSHQMALSNNFYNSLIKKRIVMLHKSKSKKINLIKYALVIPLLAVFLMSFNTKEVYVERPSEEIISNNNNTLENKKKDYTKTLKTNTPAVTVSKDIKIVFNKDLSNNDLKKIKKKLQKSEINFTHSGLKRNNEGEIISINTKFKSDGGHCTYNANKTPIEPFYFFRSGETSGVVPVKKEGFNINDETKEVKRITQEIKRFSVTITKDFTDVNFKRVIKIAKSNGVTLKFSKIKRNSKNEIIAINADFKNKDGHGNFNLNGDKPINSFAYSQNKFGFGFGQPKESQITVGGYEINGKEKPKFYEGNKVISADSIYFGKKNDIISVSGTAILTTINNEKPLFILNGKEISKEEFETLNPDKIQSINVIKDASAKVLYGNKAKDGVILISTKKKKNYKIVIRGSHTDDGTKPLIIIDGKESKKTIEDLNPDDIKSVIILKREQAIKKHGDKGKNGIVEITTKKE